MFIIFLLELFAGEAKPLVTKDECLLTAKIIEKAVESYKTGQVVNFWRTELITSLLHILVLIIARLTGMTNTELTIIKGNLSNPICVQSLELCYMRTFWIFKNYFFLCTFTLCNQTPCLFWHKTDPTARQVRQTSRYMLLFFNTTDLSVFSLDETQDKIFTIDMIFFI